MKKLDKLILKAFIGPFILTFAVAVFILLIIFMLKYFDDFVGKDIEFVMFVELMFYFAINVTPPALPLAILLSSLMTYGRLGEHFEITAIKSAGISLLRTLRPVFFFSLAISCFSFYNSNWIVPQANQDAYALLYDIKQKRPAMDLKEGQFYSGLPGFSIKVNEKLSDGITLKDVIIYDHTNEEGNMTVFMADSSRMYSFHDDRYLMLELYNGQSYSETKSKTSEIHTMDRTNFNSMKLALSLAAFAMNRTDKELFSSSRLMKSLLRLRSDFDSMRNELGYDLYTTYRSAKPNKRFSNSKELPMPESIKRAITFKNVAVPVQKEDSTSVMFLLLPDKDTIPAHSILGKLYLGTNLDLDTYELELMGVCQDSMLLVEQERLVNLKIDSIFSLKHNRDVLYSKTLSRVRSIKNRQESNIRNNQGLAQEMRRHRFEEHKRYAQSITCLIMFLIGAPLGSIIKKGGLGFPVLISIVFFVIFYVLSNTGYKMSKYGHLDEVLAGWMANMVLIPFGLFFLRQARIDARLFDPDIYLIAFDRVKSFLDKVKK